jgi:hypothetical protein
MESTVRVHCVHILISALGDMASDTISKVNPIQWKLKKKVFYNQPLSPEGIE